MRTIQVMKDTQWYRDIQRSLAGASERPWATQKSQSRWTRLLHAIDEEPSDETKIDKGLIVVCHPTHLFYVVPKGLDFRGRESLPVDTGSIANYEA